MEPANDARRDYRRLVANGYDVCAPAYNAARSLEPPAELRPLMRRLPDGAQVLDLGCGAGVPITRALAARFAVTGVDVSAGQLALARDQVPGATFLQCDMMACDFAAGSFDAVVSFYAIFHLPREEHERLFRKIHGWLRRGGYLLATLAMTDEAAYTEEFFDVEMYWSNYGIDEYRAMLERTGFDVLESGVLHHGYDDEGAKAEQHPIVLARRQD
ncbi:MAG: class I SAM-dependent methyltransferase [Chloroflexi bacterium]|nr:class I SAM-dependent methyltransferase [Chloroflexota bacterium]